MKSGLIMILSSPVRCFVFTLVVLCGISVSLEALRFLNVIDYSVTYSLQNLVLSQAGELMSSIVAADAIFLVSGGLIGSMILRYSAHGEEKGYKALMFIGLALIAFFLSVSAVVIQFSAVTFALSLILLFTGVVELCAVLAYSLGLVPP